MDYDRFTNARAVYFPDPTTGAPLGTADNPLVVSGAGGDGVQSVVAGDRITVDDTDPKNPIVTANVAAWADITGKPTTFAPIIGNTATTALAGNTFIGTPATAAPLATGPTAAVGTSANYARGDHVHTVGAATTAAVGGVKQSAFVDGASATLLDLTTALIAAGIMAAS